MRDHRPDDLSITEGCWLMGSPRPTYYEKTASTASDDTAVVEAIAAIYEEFEHDGWRVFGRLFVAGV